MKKLILVVSLFPLLAFAGKAEREWLKEKVAPAIKEAEAAYKKSCGCGLKISFDSSIKSQDELSIVRSISNHIKEGAAKHCTDAASKQAVCKMKTLDVKKASESKFTFAGSRGLATTEGQSSISFDMITDVLDK